MHKLVLRSISGMIDDYCKLKIDYETSDQIQTPQECFENLEPLFGESYKLPETISASSSSLLYGLSDNPYLSRASDSSATRGKECELEQRLQFQNHLLRILKQQDFEYGLTSEAELFIGKHLELNRALVRSWINELFLKHFANVDIVVGILQSISRIEYDEIYPEGQTIALAASFHKHPEVRECSIRAFENWESPDCLEILRNCRCSEDWLEKYRLEVIQDLEELAKDAITRP
ncbi:hypothetical protein EU77_14380 [Mesotoga sp. SC_NapDC]|nr:hypothetical protein EU77_14380 [Mesotoga sp. SC_NapDC]